METTQLVLRQLKKILTIELKMEYGLSTPKISKCGELVRLCHINCSGSVFLETV